MRRELYAEMSTGLSLHNPRKSVRLPRSKVRSCMRRTKSDDAYSVVCDFFRVLVILRGKVADCEGFLDDEAAQTVSDLYDRAVFRFRFLPDPCHSAPEVLCVFA